MTRKRPLAAGNAVFIALSAAMLAGTGCTGAIVDDKGTSDTSGVTDTSTKDTSPTETAADTSTKDTGAKKQSELSVHYAFEDSGTTVTDSSGRELHGTLSDVAALTTEGRVGGGVALLADNSRFVELPSGIFDGVDDFTIAVWVKYTTIAPWARVYDIGNGLGDPKNRFMYLTASGINGIHAAWYGGSPKNENVLISGTQLPPQVWKHLAITGTGGARTLYIDGYPAVAIPAGPDVPPLEMEPIGGQSWLGKSRFAADLGFDGTMDEFRVYDRVLTQTEIADLAWPQSDYSHWRFDEGKGTAAADSSDIANAATLNDGAAWEASGRLGAAVSLGGGPGNQAGPHVSFASPPLASCTDQFTASAWFNLRSVAAWSRVFDFGDKDRFMYLAPNDGDGNLRFAMVSPAGAIDVISAGALASADKAWHHVAVTYAPDDTITVYFDGVVAQTGTSLGPKPSDFAATADNWLGRSHFPADSFLDGSIDDLRISCRAYTADEITNLAQP